MQPHKKIMLRSFAKSICVADSSAGTGNQLHRQRKQGLHRQSVTQATSYTGNLLYAQRKHRQVIPLHMQPVTQATTYIGNTSKAASYTGNQLHRQPLT